MSVVFRRLLSAATVAAVVLSVTPAFSQVPQRGLPSRNLLSRFGLERAWSNQSTINIRSDVVLHVVADEEVVIVQTRSGMITVFDAQSGVKLWDGQLARADQYSFPAVTNGDLLFVVIGSTVYARDKFGGQEMWTLRLPSVPSTSPTVDDRRMYVGMLQGDVYAFDLPTIARNQAEGRLPQFNYENIVWHYGTSGRIVAAPVTDGKIVCFANALGSLYAVSAGQRDLKFQFETEGQASAPMDMATAVENGIDVSFIFLAAGDTNLYCLRSTNGTTRWLHVTGAPIREKPHIIGDSVYLVPLDSGVYDLDINTGRERWWAPSVTAFVAATPTRVFGTDKSGDLAVIDRGDGALLGTLPMLGFPIRVANERTDRMYLCSTSGLVTCLREEGAELPIYHRFPERRPILPLFGDQPEAETGTTDNADAPATEESGEAAAAHAEINATIDEALRIAETGDQFKLVKRFMAPERFKELSGNRSDEEYAAYLATVDKEGASLQVLIGGLKAAKTQNPTFENGYKKAVYQLRALNGETAPMTLIKIADTWYFD